MKLNKHFEYEGKRYAFLSDDSRELDSETLFVKTKTNAQFMPQHTAFIDAQNLNHIFTRIPKIIGITGTNGKTTTATLIYFALLEMGYTAALLGTRGMFKNKVQIKPKGLTTPCVLELYADMDMVSDCEFIVMEVSSHALHQERIAGLKFVAKVLTNITSDHLDYHKTLSEYIRVKNSFFVDGNLKIINADESNAHFNPKNAYTYGITKPANLKVLDYTFNPRMSAKICFDEKCFWLESKLYGLHNLYNLLAALTTLKAILPDTPINHLAQILARFEGVEGRMEIISQNPLIIIDFAHTKDGMQQIFESFKSKPIVVVFGAGGDRDKSKRKEMGACAYQYERKIYITSDNPRSEDPQSIIDDILEGIPNSADKSIFCDIDRKKSIHNAITNLTSDEILLVLGKGDECTQIFKDTTIHFSDKEVILDSLMRIKHQ